MIIAVGKRVVMDVGRMKWEVEGENACAKMAIGKTKMEDAT